MPKYSYPAALAALALVNLTVRANAVALDGEYQVNVNVIAHGVSSYTFEYAVTNVNQQIDSGIQPVGLNGFYVSIPASATITDITNPPVYTNTWPQPSYWTSSITIVDNQTYIQWWGIEWNSVYPASSTAHFSFTADNVNVGSVGVNIVTFWNANPVPPPAYFASGAYYTNYETALVGAVAVPEPASAVLFGAGVLSILTMFRARKKSACSDSKGVA